MRNSSFACRLLPLTFGSGDALHLPPLKRPTEVPLREPQNPPLPSGYTEYQPPSLTAGVLGPLIRFHALPSQRSAIGTARSFPVPRPPATHTSRAETALMSR